MTERQRWHALSADPRGVSYSLALPGWLDRGLTLDGLWDLRDQALKPAMRRPILRQWWSWALDQGDAGMLGGDPLVREWVESGEPEWASLPWHVAQLELHRSDLSAEFMRAHLLGEDLIAYELARSLRREAEDYVAHWNEHRADRLGNAAAWPEDVTLVQTSGRAKWPALLTDTGTTGASLPPLVSTAFVDALTRAECTEGWRARKVDLRDREGVPIPTHVALFIAHDLATNYYAAGDPLYAYVVDEQPRDVALAYDHGTPCASPEASRALADAKGLNGLLLDPFAWESEVPEPQRGQRAPGP